MLEILVSHFNTNTFAEEIQRRNFDLLFARNDVRDSSHPRCFTRQITKSRYKIKQLPPLLIFLSCLRFGSNGYELDNSFKIDGKTYYKYSQAYRPYETHVCLFLRKNKDSQWVFIKNSEVTTNQENPSLKNNITFAQYYSLVIYKEENFQ